MYQIASVFTGDRPKLSPYPLIRLAFFGYENFEHGPTYIELFHLNDPPEGHHPYIVHVKGEDGSFTIELADEQFAYDVFQGLIYDASNFDSWDQRDPTALLKAVTRERISSTSGWEPHAWYFPENPA